MPWHHFLCSKISFVPQDKHTSSASHRMESCSQILTNFTDVGSHTLPRIFTVSRQITKVFFHSAGERANEILRPASLNLSRMREGGGIRTDRPVQRYRSAPRTQTAAGISAGKNSNKPNPWTQHPPNPHGDRTEERVTSSATGVGGSTRFRLLRSHRRSGRSGRKLSTERARFRGDRVLPRQQ